jgi:ELWxxDGT repeat protein
MGDTLLFIAQPASSTSAGTATLYSSDGTTAGTTQVAPIGGSVLEAVSYNTGALFLSAGTKSYFLTDPTASGQQVWVTDGTAAGTHQVTNIAGTSGASPALLGLIGTNLIFADYASDNTMQLFLTDGTTAGTSTLSDFAQNQYGLVSDSIALNGKVYVALNSSLECCQHSESGGTIDTTSVQIVSKPAHGSVSMTASGSVVYTPATGFAGSDSFTYTVKDLQGALSNVASVTLGVTAAAAPSGSQGGGGGGGATLLDLLALGVLACYAP